MSEPQLAPLTGLALADALCNAGLAPCTISSFGYPVYLYVWRGHCIPWRPWESLDAVAHLLERYGIACGPSHKGLDWYIHRRGILERTPFTDLPAAIARLALRLHAAEEEKPTP